jgi:hypothetical protein
MKEMNLPETQLRSWRPRRPSARLKRKVFSATTEADLPSARWFWGCLAPAAACALLTLMAFNSSNNLEQKPLIGAVLSNENYAAYASGGDQVPQNHLAAVTFDWTNRSGFNSSISFTPTTNLSN